LNEIKNQIEAILFAAGKKVTYENIARLCSLPLMAIKENLTLLKKEYDERESPLFLAEESDGWKVTVREKYLPVVHKLMPETELSKTVLETLAVVAWKQPVMQADIIHIRTSKAYDHIQELVEKGFLLKERKGRSYILKTTGRFYEYFDLPGKEALKELFKNVQQEGAKKIDEYGEENKSESDENPDKEESNENRKNDNIEESDENQENTEEKNKEFVKNLETYNEENNSEEKKAEKTQTANSEKTEEEKDSLEQKEDDSIKKEDKEIT